MTKLRLLSIILSGILTSASALALDSAGREKLIDALIKTESHGNAKAVGDNGKALGCLQIHQIMVSEANRLGHVSYTHSEMFDPQKARKVAQIVLSHYDKVITRQTGKTGSEKQLAFIWNGGASSWKRVDKPVGDSKQKNLESYWQKVSKNLSR